MSALEIFDYAGQQVRTVLVDGEPWFVAKDVCEVLGISKPRDAVAQLGEDERASTTVDTPGGPQSMTVVAESGVYALTRFRAFEGRSVIHNLLRMTGTNPDDGVPG